MRLREICKNVIRALAGAYVCVCAFVGALVIANTTYTLYVNKYIVKDSGHDLVATLLRCAKDPCTVTDNLGGDPVIFGTVAKLVRTAHRSIVIDGQCYSGCAYFADKARPQVCVTRTARFGFHKGRWEIKGSGNTVFFDIIHSPDIHKWVMSHGGYPVDGLLVMQYPETKKFWPICKQHAKKS